tara:strand:+ start:1417 stop:1623 length:207 start_codon:yes stop_codon:yes gene_type:complete
MNKPVTFTTIKTSKKNPSKFIKTMIKALKKLEATFKDESYYESIQHKKTELDMLHESHFKKYKIKEIF